TDPPSEKPSRVSDRAPRRSAHHASLAEWRRGRFHLCGPCERGTPIDAILSRPRAQCYLLSVPRLPDRGDDPNDRGPVSGGANAASQRHPGALSRLESARTPTPGDAGTQRPISTATTPPILQHLV